MQKLNILKMKFAETGSCAASRLYFTEKSNLHQFTNYG